MQLGTAEPPGVMPPFRLDVAVAYRHPHHPAATSLIVIVPAVQLGIPRSGRCLLNKLPHLALPRTCYGSGLQRFQ